MSNLRLSLALSYYDHVSDLVRGRIRVEGITLTCIELPVEEIFFRMLSFAEWDVAEFSMAKYVSLIAAGAAPFYAIPVFPSRVFRQSAVYVRTKGPIQDPQDLIGRRVGIPEWAQTAGIYARAYLQHQCSVPLESIRWVQAGVNQPGRREKVALSVPEGINIEPVQDRSLNDMLLAGEVDAIISAREPSAFLTSTQHIERLWPDYRTTEGSYYRDTGIFPIMHTIVLKAAILQRHPWAAMNLYKAFDEAKTSSLRRISTVVTSRIPIPWYTQTFNEAKFTFGSDLWPYGIEPNRATLEAFLQFCYEQGVANREVHIDELFPREVTTFAKT